MVSRLMAALLANGPLQEVRWPQRVECVNWQAGEAVVRRADDPCRSPAPVEGQQYLRIPSVARPSGSRSQRPVGGRDRDYETERRPTGPAASPTLVVPKRPAATGRFEPAEFTIRPPVGGRSSVGELMFPCPAQPRPFLPGEWHRCHPILFDSRLWEVDRRDSPAQEIAVRQHPRASGSRVAPEWHQPETKRGSACSPNPSFTYGGP